MIFGQELRQERERLGLTRDALCDAAGVARSTLQRVEEGGNTSIETLRKINDALTRLAENINDR